MTARFYEEDDTMYVAEPPEGDLDLCFFCDGTLIEHEPDCPLSTTTTAPTSAEEDRQ